MATFRAGTQYGDLKGQASADRADNNNLHDYLAENNLLNEGEAPIGIEFYNAERLTFIRVLAFDWSGHNDIPSAIAAAPRPIPVREVRLDIDATEFLSLFKRFNIVLTQFDIIGVETTADA